MFVHVDALTFSKDTTTAFDGKFWSQNVGDDTVHIMNTSSETVVIDSIIVQFDTSGYDDFSISWMEAISTSKTAHWGTRRGFYSISDTALARQLADNGDQDLEKYNQGLFLKIEIDAGDTLTMYSPYFSKTHSEAGYSVSCGSGVCIPPGAELHYAYFPGRILFVSQNHRDTLHLSCELFWWDPPVSVLPVTTRRNNNVKGNFSDAVNLQGRFVYGREHHSTSVIVRKGRSNFSCTGFNN
jgi:hypothetical protein